VCEGGRLMWSVYTVICYFLLALLIPIC